MVWAAMLTRMARLPLHTLPAFHTVAKLQNLRAAAETLHLTHSAVSQQIRGLEEQLGFDFYRTLQGCVAGSKALRTACR